MTLKPTQDLQGTLEFAVFERIRFGKNSVSKIQSSLKVWRGISGILKTL